MTTNGTTIKAAEGLPTATENTITMNRATAQAMAEMAHWPLLLFRLMQAHPKASDKTITAHQQAIGWNLRDLAGRAEVMGKRPDGFLSAEEWIRAFEALLEQDQRARERAAAGELAGQIMKLDKIVAEYGDLPLIGRDALNPSRKGSSVGAPHGTPAGN